MMLVWRKLSSEKWLDSWEERLAFLGPERLVITQIAPSNRIRLEIFDLSEEESRLLVKQFAGEIRDLHRSTADWVKSVVQKRPISIRNRLKIASGEPDRSPPFDLKTIFIPASLAFGTGEHATTAGCLRLLADISPKSGLWTLLDAGTGTGILAIAASRFGASRVVGLDFDPIAVRIAKKNARINSARNVKIYRADVLQYKSLEPFDIIVANLYSELFRKAARPLWHSLRSGGSMIISGVMRDQLETVIQVVNDLDGKIRVIRKRGKWTVLLADKMSQ